MVQTTHGLTCPPAWDCAATVHLTRCGRTHSPGAGEDALGDSGGKMFLSKQIPGSPLSTESGSIPVVPWRSSDLQASLQPRRSPSLGALQVSGAPALQRESSDFASATPLPSL